MLRAACSARRSLYLKAEQERFPFPAAGTHGERDRDRARVALQQRELHRTAVPAARTSAQTRNGLPNSQTSAASAATVQAHNLRGFSTYPAYLRGQNRRTDFAQDAAQNVARVHAVHARLRTQHQSMRADVEKDRLDILGDDVT